MDNDGCTIMDHIQQDFYVVVRFFLTGLSAIGMESLLFSTCKRTVFKLLFEESIKSFHLSTMYYTQSLK